LTAVTLDDDDDDDFDDGGLSLEEVAKLI